ncbi:MAG: hypothetical protein ACYTGN_13315 [Planctomycetota bacterium]|jgi:hypothetical protein
MRSVAALLLVAAGCASSAGHTSASAEVVNSGLVSVAVLVDKLE